MIKVKSHFPYRFWFHTMTSHLSACKGGRRYEKLELCVCVCVCVALHEWPALDFRSHAVTSPCIRQHSETSCWSGLRSMLQRHMMWWHAMASASCWSGRGSMLQRHTILVTCYDVMLIWPSSHTVIGHGLFKQNMAFLYSYIMLPNKTAQCGDEFTTDSSRFLDTETCLFKFLKTCNIKLLF